MKIEAYLKREYIRNLVKAGERIDDRDFLEYRSLKIERGYTKVKSPGSAFVELGNTKVLVGVSLDVGQPYPDEPNKGVMTTSAELRPLADPYFEAGPPDEHAIELARVVDRGIRESNAIDLEKLFIEEDKVWIVFIDIHVLNNDGNLIDASGIAAISALLDARMPKYEDGQIIRGEWSGKLPVKEVPIPCTTAKICDKLLVDPCLDEEYSMDAQITITTTDRINAIQKSGVGAFKPEEIDQCVDIAFENAKKIRKIVKSAGD